MERLLTSVNLRSEFFKHAFNTGQILLVAEFSVRNPFDFETNGARLNSNHEQIRGESMAIKTGKRELIDTGTDKRYVKRSPDGTFKDSVDVGRSLAADRRSKSKTVAKPGYGDQGDRPKSTTKKAATKTTKKAGKKAAKK
jgi:hypothetical protein